MGIYLPNMEMPREGQMLVIFPDGTSYVCFNGMRERLAQTEAVPVPPHGRLMDADALIINLMDRGIEGVQTDDWHEVQQAVMDAPTIIEAEGEEK